MAQDEMCKLITCVEEQNMLNSCSREKAQLSNIGIQTSSSLDTAIVFRALSDILVAVNRKTDDIIICTASPEKLAELVRLNCVIPREGDFMYEHELVRNSLKYDVINTYIQKGKYHFVKLTPYKKVCSCFLCSLSSFNPYPTFVGYDVYTLSTLSSWFDSIMHMLESGSATLRFHSGRGDVICTRVPDSGTEERVGKASVLYSKLFAYDMSGAFLSIPLFDIKDVIPYYRSDFERDINSGIVRIAGKNYTSNRKILEMYYGVNYYILETQRVKERWALNDILTGKLRSLSEVNQLYRFDANIGFPIVNSFRDLEEYLIQSVGEYSSDNNKVTVRVLADMSLLTSNKVSFYRTVKLNSIPEYTVIPMEEVLPFEVTIAGVSKSYGYQVTTCKLSVGCDIVKSCVKEFERQFGSLCSELEIYKSHKDGAPLNLPLSLQRKLAESINAGDYSNNFSQYYKVVEEILLLNNVTWYSEISVQHLFINNLVRELRAEFKKNNIKGKEYIRDYSVFSQELCKYVRLVKSMDEVKHKGYLVNQIRMYNNYAKQLVGFVSDSEKEGKNRSGVLCNSLRYSINVCKKEVLLTSESIGHTISVGYVVSDNGDVTLSEKYKSVRKV